MTNPLKIRVVTIDLLDPNNPDQTKEIDHNDHDDRVWLGKHCFWAMRNNREVRTYPIIT